MGLPLARAREVLSKFFKRDESFAVDLWASPRNNPNVLVIYFERSTRTCAVWLAIDARGRQIVDRARLPRGFFAAMRAASDGSEDLLELWPEGVQPGATGCWDSCVTSVK